MRYWKKLKQDGSVGGVESYSHDQQIAGAIQITKPEFDMLLKEIMSRAKPVIDPLKVEWQSAATIDQKLDIIARKLGLKE